MAIRVRGRAFQCSITIKGRRYRKDFPTRVEAEAWEERLKSASEKGGDVPTEELKVTPVTLGELFQRTCERYWVGTKSAPQLMKNGQIIVDLLGAHTPIRSIGAAQIDSLVLAMKRDGRSYSGATINRKLAALSKMLSYAEKMGWADKRPAFEWENEPEGRLRWFTEEEEEKILAWFTFMGEADMHDFVTVCLDTGLRVSECLGLVAGEVEVVRVAGESQRLQIHLTASRLKSGKSRVIPATARVTNILSRLIRGRNTDGRLFHRLSKKGVEMAWDRCRSHMGMMDDTEFVPHTLRHTFASRLVQRGVPLFEVQKLLGHSTITLTMRYAKLAPASLVNAVAVLDRAGGGAHDTACALVPATPRSKAPESRMDA